MYPSEQVAYAYLRDQGYKETDIDFSPIRSIDFICSDRKQFEAKSLTAKHWLVFTPKQWQKLKETNPNIIVVNNNKVVDVFPFKAIKEKGYKTQIRYPSNKLWKVKRRKSLETKVTAASLTTVPSAIKEALNLSAGDYVEWHIENDKVLVRKKEEVKH